MRRFRAIAGLLLILSLATPPPANAFSITTCPFVETNHIYGNQWASGNYWGQFGWFYTYNNSIPDYQSADTLSHLYTYNGSSGPFDPGSITWVEVGYIQGFGYPNSYSTPHYWYALADHGAFDTVTSSSSANRQHRGVRDAVRGTQLQHGDGRLESVLERSGHGSGDDSSIEPALGARNGRRRGDRRRHELNPDAHPWETRPGDRPTGVHLEELDDVLHVNGSV